MTDVRLQTLIEQAWENRAAVNPQTTGDVRDAVETALEALDAGRARVAEKIPGATGPNSWKVNQWLKKAVLLSFRLNDNAIIEGGPGEAAWWDKIPSKFAGWGESRFREAGFRAVPGAIVRRSAFVARDVVLMPSFVNVGAHVDSKTMVDTWVTVGSCAQIGKKCASLGRRRHRRRARAAAGEPDHHRGRLLHRRALGNRRGRDRRRGIGRLDGGVHRRLDQGRRPRDRKGPCRLRAALFGGRLRLPARQAPARRLAGPSLYCAVIVKTVDAQTRAKTGINELLRE